MNRLDKQYQALLQDILDNGVEKKDRTGTGTISVFGRQIRHKMPEGFPLLTTKKMPWKSIVTELLWFLRGDTNIKYLVDNGCNIWNGDAYKNYEKWWDNMSKTTPFEVPKKFTEEELVQAIKLDEFHAKQFGELGPIYGKQWRTWEDPSPLFDGLENIDQIQNLINDLKTNPDSRRLMVNAWNVGELDQMVLPPCHYGFQVYTRELSFDERKDFLYEKFNKMTIPPVFSHTTVDDDLKNNNIPTRAVSLMWNQRSVDTFLGLPFNIASYGLLLEIIAREVNMVPDELIGNLGDVHLYSNHIEQAEEQIGRDLTDEERYNIWFNNNYETGMERYFNPNDLPDFDNDYYTSTPKRTREPYLLPALQIMDYDSGLTIVGSMENWGSDDFVIKNYQSHTAIKAPLSN
jgi:thymidylate synthase